MKNGVEQDIENIESFYDVEKNIYNIAKILKNQDVNNISNIVNKLNKNLEVDLSINFYFLY